MEVTLARGRSPFSKRRYDSAQRLSGAVVDDVVAIPVDRPQQDAWMTRQTWRAADGREIPSRVPRRGFYVVQEW